MHTTALLARRRIAERTVEVCLERPGGFVFEPGQYVQLRLAKLRHRDRKGRSRVFSIASSPLDDQQICVAYRETGSGFKQTLWDLPIGTEVLIWTPKQAAYLDELSELERSNPRLTLRTHFGAVDESALRKLVKHGAGQLWFIAGPPAMVDATRSVLHVLRVDPDDVHVEEFVGY